MNLKLLFFPPEIEKHFLPMLEKIIDYILEHVYHNNNKYSTEKNQRSNLAILDLSCLKPSFSMEKFTRLVWIVSLGTKAHF